MSVWLLPENIADMLPREAEVIESLRSTFLKLVTSHGFEVVRPPLIEYVESLLTGTGSDLDLRTFKTVDQASGRSIGIRADMTPQVARIDAHILNRTGVSRLCYVGSVLHARPLHPMASRQPYVAGVECFGSSGIDSDREVISLGVCSLKTFGLAEFYLDIGHTGIVEAILNKDPSTEGFQEQILFALSHKDRSAIEALKENIADRTISDLVFLMTHFGEEKVLDAISERFSGVEEIQKILKEVRYLGQMSGAHNVSYDFADVHGYRYLTGVTFSVSIPGRCQAVLRGGRYDDIGAKFGRKRPAVGFTLYLREIVGLMETHKPAAIIAPTCGASPELSELIESLRKEGKIVVELLPEDNLEALRESFCIKEQIVCDEAGRWTLTPFELAVNL